MPAGNPLADAPARVRPPSIAALMGGAFAMGTIPAAIVVFAMGFEDVPEAIAAWTMASMFVALPLAAAIAMIGWRAERALTERNPPGSGFWPLTGAGITAIALWAPLCAWTPMLVVATLIHPGKADDYLPLAMLSLACWAVVAVGIGLLFVARRLDGRRDWSKSAHVPYRPSVVPTTALLGGASALIAVVPAVLWLAWLDEVWSRGAGLAGVVAWGLSGAGGAVLAAWLAGMFSVGASTVNPALANRLRVRQAEVVGAVLAGQWGTAFLLSLSPPLRHAEDLRFSVLFVALFATIAGVAVWSFARTLRTSAGTATA